MTACEPRSKPLPDVGFAKCYTSDSDGGFRCRQPSRGEGRFMDHSPGLDKLYGLYQKLYIYWVIGGVSPFSLFVVGRCMLTPSDPKLPIAERRLAPRWFQPLHLSSEKPVSKFAFQNATCATTSWASSWQPCSCDSASGAWRVDASGATRSAARLRATSWAPPGAGRRRPWRGSAPRSGGAAHCTLTPPDP
jgi:hypothetical protein